MLKNYIKIAIRNLWRHRGFSFINISGLAIGLTAGFFILLYVGLELSYDKFHTKAGRIYRVVADIKTPTDNIEASIAAWAVAPHLKKEFPEIESAVRISRLNVLVRKDELKFIEENAIAADSAFFNLFDFKLTQGDSKKVLKAPFSIVLSKTTAKKYFGDIDPMGKSLKIFDDGRMATVTGVMEDIPENSHIKADMVLSMTSYTQDMDKELDSQWDSYDASAYILVGANTNINQLESKFPGFLERNNGEAMRKDKMFVTLFLEPL
ncbi:MAG TPA: ABC transporter permease, partial [Flavobacteriia bacterium]|nr:ABC transporter permease [Flavobacteriia bacterium]